MNYNSQQANHEGTSQAAQNRSSVTIIGLGPMGQAMAGVFLDRGYEVTVWNRTSGKADALD